MAISRLDKTWRERGEPCIHQTFAIAFVDDLLLTYANWAQADRLTLELQACLRDLGLQPNLSKISVMTHASQLAAGKDHEFTQDCIIASIQWVESCTYLRKTLQHLEVGVSAVFAAPGDTSAILIEAMGRSCHAAYEGLSKALRKGHWSLPEATFRLCNTYVGGTWYWYSPLIEPLQRHVDSVRCLQVTMLVLMLGLYIPADLPQTPCLFLDRLRRRLVLVLLRLLFKYDWVGTWIRRRWNSLGNLLRFEPAHITRAALSLLCTVRQACPGPWQHLFNWCLTQCRHHVEREIAMQTMEGQAHDRDLWNA